MDEKEIEIKAPLKDLEKLVSILENSYGDEFIKSLPCSLIESYDLMYI